MIEEALRRQMQPTVDRRRHVYLAWRMAACWLVATFIGVVLAGVAWLWGSRSPWAVMALFIGTFLATVWVVYRSRRMQPDYHALARTIEEQHPELQALLLAAVEQKPEGPDGEWGYLQRRVIGEAIEHAAGHEWQESISATQLFLANLGRFAAMVFLFIVLLQVVPSTSFLIGTGKGILTAQDYTISVSPGDTEIEQGSPVVILGRFEGKAPSNVSLFFTPAGQEPQRIPLNRSLDDPVFGGILQDVRSDMRYHVEYEGKRTREYTISVFQSPELLRADATIVYPAYTKLPEKTIEDTRQIAVVEGSKVTLRFTLNKPVATARLSPRSGIALALTMDPDDPNVLTTSITASQSERYELHVADAQGRPNKMPPRFTIDVHKNLPAEIKPVFPNRDVVASPLEEIDLRAEVSDDYGVTRYGLTYTLAGTESRDIRLDTQTPAETPQIQYLLAMEDLKAQPDQLLTYYFWADDVGPDGSPRRTAGDIYFAEVRPFEEIFRESQSFQSEQNQEQQNQQGEQQNQSADRLAQLQKQIITATWNIKQKAEQSGGIAGHKDDLDVVRQSQSDALEQAQKAMAEAEDPASIKSLRAAAEHMTTSLDHLIKSGQSGTTNELTTALAAEQSAYQELLKLREREHQIARSRSNSSRASANSSQFQQQLQQLELTQREDRYETRRMAQPPQQTERQEDLQALNRLRDLARRQNEMTDRLREAEAALRQAKNDQERQEALRQLKRLRDEQMEALRDTDDLQQRMESPQNRQRMGQARKQLDDSREQIRQSTEALEEGMLSRAITSTARAGRQLEQMRDEFQRRTSNQFSDAMRDMRDQARELDRQQNEIAEQMRQQIEARQKSLAGDDKSKELAERVEKQRQAVEELVDRMKTTSEQAEVPEPLLSRKLYDTLRETGTENLDRALQATGELLKRDFLPQAQEIERRAGEGIDGLRKGVEEAAENVLGDEAESLRLARQRLDELIRDVNEEVAQATGARRSQSNDFNEPADAPGRRQQTRQGGSPQDGRQQQDSRQGQARDTTDERTDPTGRGGLRTESGEWDNQAERGPFTGEDFLTWSDRLRDVEDMLPERDLRDEAARVWDRARAVRAEFKRHGTEPQWDLVRSQIMEPLAELRQRVGERLAQLQSNDARVPIDRDPVPDRFADVVRSYFENLGQQENP
jgi:FtsH-binding integral membrane protein